jgi:DNA-binding GntR family transcriptional regulator
MQNSPIKPGSIPKYRQLLQILRNQILSQQFDPGEQLPTEEELSIQYGLSRGTVRKAVAQLDAEKLIRIEHGVGSFVRAAPASAIPFRFADHTSLYPAIQGKVTYTVLEQLVMPAPLDIAERLRIPPNTPVIHVGRVKRIDGEPVAYTLRYLPESLCPSLLNADLRQGTVHDVLVNHSELPLLRAEMEIEAHLLTGEEAEILNVAEGKPAIVIERLTYTAPNRPAVWFQAFHLDEASLAAVIDDPPAE